MYDTATAAAAAHTPAGAARRPSPRPLRVVPDPPPAGSEVPTSGNPGSRPVESISAGQDGSTQVSEVPGFRVRAAGWWATTRSYWTPPAGFTDRPASLQELAAYARHAPWTAQQSGPLRALGVGWYRLVGYPKTVKNRYSEWVWQRPLRLAAHIGVIKLVSLTGPGAWTVDHIVYPAAQLAGRIFL